MRGGQRELEQQLRELLERADATPTGQHAGSASAPAGGGRMQQALARIGEHFEQLFAAFNSVLERLAFARQSSPPLDGGRTDSQQSINQPSEHQPTVRKSSSSLLIAINAAVRFRRRSKPMATSLIKSTSAQQSLESKSSRVRSKLVLLVFYYCSLVLILFCTTISCMYFVYNCGNA